MQINQELTNKLIKIIRDAQPVTNFSGNIIQYGSETFVLPYPAQRQINNTKQSFR